MTRKHDLSHVLVRIPVGGTKLSMIQNTSNQALEWTPTEGSNDFYRLQPGDFLKLNYDVWVKSDTHGVSHLTAGTAPYEIVHTYREGVTTNKTHVQSSWTHHAITTDLSIVADLPEVTIQKNKNIKVSIRAPAFAEASAHDGIVVQTAAKVNGVDHILCDSDKVLCQSTNARMAQTYNKTYIMDFIAAGLVAEADADAPYTVKIKLSAKSATRGARFGGGSGSNDSAVPTHGTLLPSARSQNFLSVIIEEVDR